MKYICPMCLTSEIHETTEILFPKHCGHYMVEEYLWKKDENEWMKAREFELSHPEQPKADVLSQEI